VASAPAATPAPDAATKAAATNSPALPPASAEAMEPIPGAVADDAPAVGTLVKRDFLWPDDTPVMAGGAGIVSPSLKSTAN
jgi:hypothetical protein